jgi:hypothetical protein
MENIADFQLLGPAPPAAPPSWSTDPWCGAEALGKAPSRFFPSKFSFKRVEGGVLYVDGIKPTDVNQGALGDCWFLAAVAALAERDAGALAARISALKEGVYAVTLWPFGKPTTVVVDDTLPHKGEKLAYSNGGKELWVGLLEKAMAKQYGSYAKLDGGFSSTALAWLTGSPCTVHTVGWGYPDVFELVADTEWEHKVVVAGVSGEGFWSSPLVRYLTGGLVDALFFLLWKAMLIVAYALTKLPCWLGRLLEALLIMPIFLVVLVLKAGWRAVNMAEQTLLCGVVSNLLDCFSETFIGLVHGHAFSVLEVKTIPVCCGLSSRKFVRVRNPWGKVQWRDPPNLLMCNCICATAELPVAGPGEYWMRIEDFRLYFDRVDILHIQKGWAERRWGGTLSGGDAALTFTVTKPCKMRLSVFSQEKAELTVKEGGKDGARLFPSGWLVDSMIGFLENPTMSHATTTDELNAAPGTTYRAEIRCVVTRRGVMPFQCLS